MSSDYFVFRNLISNAIKFTPRHGLILIGAKSHENRIICKVEDNGVGLSREAMDNIFKLENTISTKGTEGGQIFRNNIEWDGKNDIGDDVAKGGYICRIMVKSSEGVKQVIRKIGVLH